MREASKTLSLAFGSPFTPARIELFNPLAGTVENYPAN